MFLDYHVRSELPSDIYPDDKIYVFKHIGYSFLSHENRFDAFGEKLLHITIKSLYTVMQNWLIVLTKP